MAIVFTKPNTDQEFDIGTIVNFEGTADIPVTQVELWADDRWLMGTVPVNQGKWALSYRFNGSGTRSIHARGLDANGIFVEQDQIWVFIGGFIDLNQNLTPNFTLREMTRSTRGEMLGLDNTPTPGEIERLRTLCQTVLQPARDALGPITVNSAFRSKEVNEAVGGVSNSAHRLGYAADIELGNNNTRNRELALWIIDNKMSEIDQIILEFGTLKRPQWIHVSVEPKRPKRQQILRATTSAGRIVYTTISANTIRTA